ncbi:MAG: adenylate/guanylate cyclase domain-containing protein [Nitrosopumilus sp.]|nr:adenylate/guanylate cyclase domain-containing protein [Nitrosopumilus sp.]
MKEALTNIILPAYTYSKKFDLLANNPNEEYVASMVGTPKYFCVGIIDIIGSTKTVAKLPQNKVSRYYEIFLNTMAKTINQFSARILKTMGDSLLFYFPDTCHGNRKFGFLSSIECGFSLINTHTRLNYQLNEEYLPKIDFRISFDYGNVTIMKTADSAIDLVGPTINTCSKINSLAAKNEMIIGSDHHEQLKKFDEYKFKQAGSYSVDLKHSYPTYTVSRKN